MRQAVWIVFFVVVLYLPFYLEAFDVQRWTTVTVYATAVLGLNLLTGFNGQISVGHGAFFGVGAYTTAILVSEQGWPHLATIIPAAVICFGIGACVGLPALRIRGSYLALVTLALATVFPTVIQHYQSVTGGTQGKRVPTFQSPFSGLAQDQWGYFLALAFAVVIFVLVRNIIDSRVGRALVAVRDNEIAATVVGVDVPLYKVLTFGVSAMIAGVAGALSVMSQPFPFVDARSFTIVLSINFLVAATIGGPASLVGAIIGAIFIERAPTVIEALGADPALVNVFLGALLILLMFVAPGGIVGLEKTLRARFVAAHARRADLPSGDRIAATPSTVQQADPLTASQPSDARAQPTADGQAEPNRTSKEI